MNDAELSVGIEDNLTPTLQKMAAQTRAFGSTIGAEAKKIDKAVRDVTKSIGDLNNAGTKQGGTKSPLAARTAQLTAELKAQEQVLARLARAQGAYASSTSFSGFRDASGKGISAKDVQAYQNATVEAQRLRGALAAIPEAERRITQAQQERAQRAKAHNAEQLNSIRQLNQATTAYAAKQAMYQDMFGKKSWWPPDMFTSPAKFADKIANMQSSVRYAMYDVSRNTAIAGAAVLALGVGAVTAAAMWERAFADVERTVQGTPETLEQIRQGLISLSQDIPVNFRNLSEIASLGGQMGITANGIVAYTETIAKLTATTNLTADAAGKALGRFKAFFAESKDPSLAVTDQTFSSLASSILKVGVNSVATESGIVNVATQISSMGSYAGLTADQVIGLSGALSSIGVPPELSRGVITRLFNLLGDAVSANGVRLKDFARLAGVSAEEFRQAWGTEKFGVVFTKMIAGLGEVARGGGDAVNVLHDLGITSVRDVPVLLRLANAAGEAGTAGGLLAQTMNDARSGWRENIELTIQYNKIAQTLVERTKVLFQNFEALFATMGQSSVGPLKALVDGVIILVKGFTDLAASPVGQTLGAVTVGASVLAGTLLLLTAGATRAFGALQGLSAGLTAITGSTAAATAVVRGLGFAMAGLGAVAAIGSIIGLFVALSAGANEANNAIQDTQGALAAMKDDAANLDGLIMTDGLKNASKDAGELRTQADSLGKALGYTKDNLYDVGDAADSSASAVEYAALRYGKSSAEFARAALIQQKAFSDLFAGDAGANFADTLVKGGFDVDKALKASATGDRNAVRDYLEKIGGEFDNVDALRHKDKTPITFEDADRFLKLLDILDATGAGMRAVSAQAYATGEAFTAFTSATQLSESAMEDFEAANSAAIKSMSDGFGKFVDPSGLIDMTQKMKEAFAVVDDGSTEVNEHAESIAKFEQAWADAYGGAKFSIEDYMGTFRRAAEEQQVFIANIQTLAARGVPSDILTDLAAMGPAAQNLVQALVDSTDKQLDEYVELYGTTGFESMVAMAAGQLAAQQIVVEAAKHLSTVQLRKLSADLAAGTPLTDAMRKWNLDAQGKPMTAPATVKSTDDFMWRFQQNANARGPIYIGGVVQYTANYDKLPKGSTFSVGLGAGGFAGGGYTGPGGKYDYAGPVHRGEFVHEASDVDQSTGLPKTSVLLRMLSGRVQARRGPTNGGYAGGGYVTGGGGEQVVHLSIEDRMLLIGIREAVGFSITSGGLTTAVNTGNANASYRRTA